jgi:hypothetical protein
MCVLAEAAIDADCGFVTQGSELPSAACCTKVRSGPLVTDAAPCKFLHEGRRPVEIAAETGRWLQFALRSAVRTKYEFYVVAIRAAFLVVRI